MGTIRDDLKVLVSAIGTLAALSLRRVLDIAEDIYVSQRCAHNRDVQPLS
jgi:hypothetical protein